MFHWQHQLCKDRALPSACAGQPSRPRYVLLHSVTPDCSGSSRFEALADAPFRPPALASRPLTWKAKVGYVVDTTEWTSGRVLEAPATGIGEKPTTDRRDAPRLFLIAGGGSPAALPPMIHGGVTARLPRGAFTLADLVRWLVWPRPVTPPS